MKTLVSNFLIGFGSILDISGDSVILSFKNKSDAEKLQDDWAAIGSDFSRVFMSNPELTKNGRR